MTTTDQPGYDYAYLKETVGTPLTKALAQVALHQPHDPVDYVGNFLLQHVANLRRQEKVSSYKAKKKEWDAQAEELAQAKQAQVDAQSTQEQEVGSRDYYKYFRTISQTLM